MTIIIISKMLRKYINYIYYIYVNLVKFPNSDGSEPLNLLLRIFL